MCRPAYNIIGRPRASVLLFLGLMGCVSPVPRLQSGDIGIIAGKDTAGLNDETARGKVLSEAARLTVDHGYRYFVVLPATNVPAARANTTTAFVRAGQPLRFQILRRNPSPHAPGIWDAYRLLAQKPGTR